MNPALAIQCPLRRPQWRLDRAIQLISAPAHRAAAWRTMIPTSALIEENFWSSRLPARMKQSGMRYFLRPRCLPRSPAPLFAGHRTPADFGARLLTSETFEEIAQYFGTSAGTIDYFEKLFFNVRDRMQCRGWILKAAVIGPRSRYRDHKMGCDDR